APVEAAAAPEAVVEEAPAAEVAAVEAAPAAEAVVEAAPVTWMPLLDLATQLNGLGYTVLSVSRVDDAYYLVNMTDANGMPVVSYLDPATGTPVAGPAAE
ncbi:PepSY domain-containing protein, partial [Cereibacter changlensis]